MKRLTKFFTLDPGDRALLVRAGMVLVVVRVGLWIVPYSTLRRALTSRAPKDASPAGDDTIVTRVAWAVDRAARFAPAATCLTQALAAEYLLNGLGQPSCLRIGVAKGDGGKLKAHAWLESRGAIVVGDHGDLPSYSVLTSRREDVRGNV